MNFKPVAFAALMAFSPLAAQAITISVDAGGTTDSATSMGSSVSYINTDLNGWNLNLSSTGLTTGDSVNLNSNTVSAIGEGTLVITATEDYSFSFDPLRLIGTASVSNAAASILVEHFVDFGSGQVQIGSGLDFGSSTGAMETSVDAANDGTFELKTVFTIVTTAADTFANVNGDITASQVPVPAAGALLLGGLGGLFAARRRKAKKTA